MQAKYLDDKTSDKKKKTFIRNCMYLNKVKGMSQAKIAKDFGVHPRTIFRYIKLGKNLPIDNTVI